MKRVKKIALKDLKATKEIKGSGGGVTFRPDTPTAAPSLSICWPGTDAWSFAKLGDDLLQASKFLHEDFKGATKWPIYAAAFEALENFLKAFLLLNGATLDHAHYELGHKLRDSLKEAKAKGLVLKVPPAVEDAVMKAGECYAGGQSSYNAARGEWSQVPPHLVINFADQVRRDARL